MTLLDGYWGVERPDGSIDEIENTVSDRYVSKERKPLVVKTFLICPVRGVDPSVTAEKVAALEAQSFTVHWPPRDTDQNDAVGLRICRDNAAAIAAADVVHVVWDGKSQGCLFDLGVAFALGKRVIPVDLPAPSEGKSFQNMVREWSRCDK